MPINRREMLLSLVAGVTAVPSRSLFRDSDAAPAAERKPRPLRGADGRADWRAVRALFPLAPDWTHLAAFLFVSHPKPVAESIDYFRKKLDSDLVWGELAALTDSEGRPFAAVKRALAEYVGGAPSEICLTSNTTGALAMTYPGLRIRRDQEILTTEHDHYSHHESIRYAAARSGCSVRYVALYDKPAEASAGQIVDRVAKAIVPIRGALPPTAASSSWMVCTGSRIRTWTSRASAVTSSRRERTSGCSRRAAPVFSGDEATCGPNCDRRFPRSSRTAWRRGMPG